MTSTASTWIRMTRARLGDRTKGERERWIDRDRQLNRPAV